MGLMVCGVELSRYGFLQQIRNGQIPFTHNAPVAWSALLD